jgi:hypothetical protein
MHSLVRLVLSYHELNQSPYRSNLRFPIVHNRYTQNPIKRTAGNIETAPQATSLHPSAIRAGLIVKARCAPLKKRPETIANGIANNPTTHPTGVGVSALFILVWLTFGINSAYSRLKLPLSIVYIKARTHPIISISKRPYIVITC